MSLKRAIKIEEKLREMGYSIKLHDVISSNTRNMPRGISITFWLIFLFYLFWALRLILTLDKAFFVNNKLIIGDIAVPVMIGSFLIVRQIYKEYSTSFNKVVN